MSDDIRERIARAIEAEMAELATRPLLKSDDPRSRMRQAYREAAQIARETPLDPNEEAGPTKRKEGET